MSWQLERPNHRGRDGMYVDVKGSFEDCIEEMFYLKTQGGGDIDRLVLTWERDD